MAKQFFTGRLDSVIEIMMHKDVSDGAGGTEPGSELYWKTYAEVKPTKSMRLLQGGQKELIDSFKITVRDRRDKNVKPNMFIAYKHGFIEIISFVADYRYNEYAQFIAVWTEQPIRAISDEVEAMKSAINDINTDTEGFIL